LVNPTPPGVPDIPSVIVGIKEVATDIGSTGYTGATGSTGVTGPAGISGVSSGLVLFMDTTGGTYPQNGTLNLIPNTSAQTKITATNLAIGNSYLFGTFFTASNSLSSTFIAGGVWDMNLYTSVNQANACSYYFDLYYVDSDGTSNPTLIATGTVPSSVTLPLGQDQTIYSLYVPQTTLPDLTKRLRVRLYINNSKNNVDINVEFRDTSVSHIHTTIVTNSSTGPTGMTGPTGPGFTTINYETVSASNLVLITNGTTDSANAYNNLTYDNTTKTLTAQNISTSGINFDITPSTTTGSNLVGISSSTAGLNINNWLPITLNGSTIWIPYLTSTPSV